MISQFSINNFDMSLVVDIKVQSHLVKVGQLSCCMKSNGSLPKTYSSKPFDINYNTDTKSAITPGSTNNILRFSCNKRGY